MGNILRKISIAMEHMQLFFNPFKRSPDPNPQPVVAIEATAKKGERTITINGKAIEMPATVRHGIVFQNIFVVVLDAYYSMTNVLAFDANGNQIWIIEDPEFEVPGVGYALVDGSDGILMALCRGVQYFIDPKTGKIYDYYFDK